MERITISRDDDLYEAFADIAQTPDGMLAVTYRESLRHGPQPFSRVAVRTKERTNGQRVEKWEAAAGVRNRSLIDHAGQGNDRCLVDPGLSQGLAASKPSQSLPPVNTLTCPSSRSTLSTDTFSTNVLIRSD